MDNFDLSSVNAETTENVVDSQTTETVDTTESVNGEVANSTVDTKPVQQTPAENARYASIRREAEAKAYAKAQDDLIAQQYGASHGIYTKADYDRAVAEQEAEEQRQQYQEQYGIDPNIIDERVKRQLENHPAVQQAKEQARSLQLNNAALELGKVAQSLGINTDIKSWADVEALPKYEAIKNSIINNNLDIVTATKLAYFDDVVNSTSTKAQQEAIQKISANAQSSPGSLVNHGTEETFFTKEQVSKMSKDEVQKNLVKIQKSASKW